MEQTITVTLPDNIRSVLDDIRRRDGVSLDDLVREALDEYLFFRRFRLLREQMIPRAQAQGICTDEDVFEQVS